ncbi:unconventional myosin-XVIIIa-like [Liolophura sinensis]|uniref:unconventional myosin-XVIIIa-like n=1 Tax=Liolophura sinensis TaxID=3198878 RepID=UPI00315817EB
MAAGKRHLKAVASLGTVNQALTIEQVPKMKEVVSAYRDQSKLRLHGNRLSVPPLKCVDTMVERASKPETTASSEASMASLDVVERKELSQVKAKEKQLHSKIANLNKIIEDLKKQLRLKETALDDLEVKIKMKEEDYREQIQKERKSHLQTRYSLDQTSEQLAITRSDLHTLREEYELKLKCLKEQKEAELSDLKEQKDDEIARRDNTLRKLKKQMADALMDNSKERQVQLEELTKELSRVQEDSEILQFKLRTYRNKQQASCPGCKDLTQEVNRLKPLTKRQDETIRDLQVVCTKLELQLSEQDELLQRFEVEDQLKSLTPP